MIRIRPRVRRFGVACLAGTLLALTASTGSSALTIAEPPSLPPAFEAMACPGTPSPVPTPGGDVRCGMVSVPAHYDAVPGGGSNGRSGGGTALHIAVAVVPAALPSGRPPLVLLAGGPGEKLVEPVLENLAFEMSFPTPIGLAAFAATRDLVLIDQRGAGLSTPALECPEVEAAWAATTDATRLVDNAVGGYRSCHDRLVGEGIDLSAFNTTDAALDVEEVRLALGYDRIDLFGTSYGARLALQVARHPAALDALVLASSIPPEANFVADVGRSYDHALVALAAACTADDACHRAVPDLIGALDGVLARLDAAPQRVTQVDPLTGTETSRTVDAFLFDAAVYSLFYAGQGPALIPGLVEHAAAGDFSLFRTAPVAAALAEAAAYEPAAALLADPSGAGAAVQGRSSVSLGQQVTFLCSEEATQPARLRASDATTAAARLFTRLHPILGPHLLDVCAVWPVPAAPATVFAPVTSAVAALVVSGAFDHITPPPYATAVAAELPAAVLVSASSRGHSPVVASGACGTAVVVAFLDASDRHQVDSSCLAVPISFALLA